ncbi:hypothetical protein [Undibacterium terreum]|uniref:LTXXQ motif family protein n=1 Tax=Undibacterium terreum TaxID=1224302 RepID=A0A916U4L2_9BURK|nr:hypothetical protein [Undibacterium terreum]GGC59763.1 hypothetical protein GCM10011396_03320 [Undibacterium terreum]
MKLIARKYISSITVALACAFAGSAHAVSVMDLKLESLVPRMAEIKKALNLNPNQQTLWQQTEAKTNNILHTRELRRDRLQAEIGQRMDQSGGELRDMARLVDAEEDMSEQEARQLRELWLTVNDALDDNQRQIAQGFLAEQLRRQTDGPQINHEKSGGDAPKRGGGRKGGMGGSIGGGGGSAQF